MDAGHADSAAHVSDPSTAMTGDQKTLSASLTQTAIWVFALAAGLTALAGCGSSSSGASQERRVAAAPPPRHFPHPDRVAVLVLETGATNR